MATGANVRNGSKAEGLTATTCGKRIFSKVLSAALRWGSGIRRCVEDSTGNARFAKLSLFLHTRFA